MQNTPKKIEKYLSFSLKQGGMVLKDDAPSDIVKEAVDWERDFYSKTSRRRIVNLDIDEETIKFVFENN